MTLKQSFLRALALNILVVAVAGNQAMAQVRAAGDPGRGGTFFEANCATCHTPNLGPGNTVIIKQGPTLVGVVGRRAGSSLGFNHTKALSESGILWDSATLDRFLTNPLIAVPGTTMPMPVPDATNRLDVIAYLSTLVIPAGVTLSNSVVQLLPATVAADNGAWQQTTVRGSMREMHVAAHTMERGGVDEVDMARTEFANMRAASQHDIARQRTRLARGISANQLGHVLRPRASITTSPPKICRPLSEPSRRAMGQK